MLIPSTQFKIHKTVGFTLIELLVTLVILSLLATAAAPVMQLSVKRSKEQELKRALWQIRDAIDAYKQAVDDGLILQSIDRSGYPKNLETLAEGVVNIKDPKKRKIYFLRQIPRDPFAKQDGLPAAETWRLRSYSSSFDQLQAGDDVYDVHSFSSELGLDKRPYSEW